MSAKKKQIRQKFNDDCLKRDGYRCRICTCLSTRDLEVHHITDRSKMPNGGYVKENGITLCPMHHLIAERYHVTGGKHYAEKMHPNDLYALIGSSYEKAVAASEKL